MDWQKRLYDHEEDPPSQAWEAIRDEISSHPADLGRKLGEMEVQPPAMAWDNIRKAISPDADRKAIPSINRAAERGAVRSLPSRAFAYAASIAGIGLLASLLYWFSTEREKEGVLLGGAHPSTSPVAAPGTKSQESFDETAATGMPEAAADSVSPLRFTQVRKSSLPGRIELCDDRGNCVAVSNKLSEMAESMGPGFNASAAKAVKSRKWNRTLRRWQKRMQDSQYLPNPGNLFDIGQLADLLSQKQ
jgi:hypothetical protein